MVLLPESAGRQALGWIGDARIVLYTVLLSLALTIVTIGAALGARQSGAAVAMALVVVGLLQALA